MSTEVKVDDSPIPGLDPRRTLEDLRQLQRLTSTDHGAQRVAFSPGWHRARDFLQSRLMELPVEVHTDPAGNLWSTLTGQSARALVIGGHLDSVPDGGWLDGCLDVLAGLEVLRWLHAQYPAGPPVTVRLVDWADEEGARFGRSLFGSSAAAGTLDEAGLADLRDADGVALADALATAGVQLGQVSAAQRELDHVAAYLELHIEQGPVLEELGQPLGAVLGTMGVRRFTLIFRGQAAHSGTTPMALRRDAFLAAARFTQDIYAASVALGGVCTVGRVTTRPGAVNCVVGECELLLEQRCLDVDALTAMAAQVHALAGTASASAGCGAEVHPLWIIDPVPFDAALLEQCAQTLQEVTGTAPRLPSGAIHDASSLARRGIPSGMLFVRSVGGLSHTPLEDTVEVDLLLSVRALAGWTRRVMDWLAGT